MQPKQLQQAVAQLSGCQLLGPYIKKVGACQLKRVHREPFAALVSAIGSQQLSNKAAATIVGRVWRLVDDKVTPDSILSVSFEQLRACGLSQRKAEYIQLLAQNMRSGVLDLSQLDSKNNQEIIELLVTQKGIGRWTAEMFLIFCLGRIDVFSELDLGLQKGMRIVFDQPELAVAEMPELAARWSPYRSVASWYLWRIQEF